MAAGRNGQLEIARFIEDGFHLMGKLLNLPQLQKSGQAFNGVETAENGIQSFGVTGIALDGQNLRLQASQMFAGFQHEVGKQFGIFGQRVRAGNGFLVQQPLTSAAVARSPPAARRPPPRNRVLRR